MNILNNIKNTEIKDSTLHGKGLFATADIPKGTLLCILSGQIISRKEYFKLLNSETYDNQCFVEKYNVNENYVAAMPFRTKYSMINHSNVANIESSVINNQLHVFASKDIKKGEELTDVYNLNKHLDVLGGFKK